MWWEARKEWALCIRADLHYRFVVTLVIDLLMWTVNEIIYMMTAFNIPQSALPCFQVLACLSLRCIFF